MSPLEMLWDISYSITVQTCTDLPGAPNSPSIPYSRTNRPVPCTNSIDNAYLGSIAVNDVLNRG